MEKCRPKTMSDQVVHPQIEMRKISSREIVDGIRPHSDRCIPQQCVASALEINEVPAPDLLKVEIDDTSMTMNRLTKSLLVQQFLEGR